MMEGASPLSFELFGTSEFGLGPVHVDRRMRSVNLIKACCAERENKASDVHTEDHRLHQP